MYCMEGSITISVSQKVKVLLRGMGKGNVVQWIMEDNGGKAFPTGMVFGK